VSIRRASSFAAAIAVGVLLAVALAVAADPGPMWTFLPPYLGAAVLVIAGLLERADR
jgi:hypothetical protein